MERVKLTPIEVNDAELKVIELMRKVEFGQLMITVKRGVPVHVDEIHKTIALPPVK